VTRSKWDLYDLHNNLEARSILFNAVYNDALSYLYQKDHNNDLPAAVLFLHIAKRGQIQLTTDAVLLPPTEGVWDGVRAGDRDVMILIADA
jgi:hypothetical protein